MANFRVGQKVVCVDNDPLPDTSGWRCGSKPTVNQVYTIRGNFIDADDDEVVLLVELDNGSRGYMAARFRPAVERKTDIGIFTAMLNPAKTKARV